jgi:hypothetical protein
MKSPNRIAWYFAATMAWPLAAVAQTAPPVAPATPPAPGATTVPPEVIKPQAEPRTQSGVVHPPSGVDPAIVKPTPPVDPQVTPVIPPPGTPGGNPNVQPK